MALSFRAGQEKGRSTMNYRHSFHAGNFADLVKHALILWLIRTRQAKGAVTVIDTHAGAGLYDLQGDAVRSREAEAGVLKLMAATGVPPHVAALADEVRALNPGYETVRVYPGSPVLIARALRSQDRYHGFELRDEVAHLLGEALTDFPNASGQSGDGYNLTLAKARGHQGPVVLIDPPFERPDDYQRSAELAMDLVGNDSEALVAIWTPLKDMETFDSFLRRLSGNVLVAEARLRPLTNPMKMNGCSMVFLNAPSGTEDVAAEVCGWVAETLGDSGARGEVWRL